MIRPAIQNIVREKTPLLEAMQVLEGASMKILLVVDSFGRLKGTCTDGDIRRFILRGEAVQAEIQDVMKRDPVSLGADFNPGDVTELLQRHHVRHIPVTTEDGRVVGLVSDFDPISSDDLDVPVVLMAGGLGSRLMPLTQDCPKPLLPLGEKPLLQHIIERFRDQGFTRFYISINYLGHKIEQHFGTGRGLGVQISYLREEQRLGTAGALSLLPSSMERPTIVMNGDILTDTDFRRLVAQHRETNAVATLCVREHLTAIPFGVVDFKGSVYRGMREKPTIRHHVNAGIYCLSKTARDNVPSGQFHDMPTLFDTLASKGHACSVHVVHDSWIDIGSRDQYETARSAVA